ncbi:Ribonuclease [Actinidia chinensis var. chinensis]|uniref:Ribonuclease n=1 Tax=Actinidia chinensis var. chinensis TaxID=1590841 RepID=A0A2R6PQZ2_ACTCC|nr:Ribonuclease [Actinidia chinensis var. chinensis]
MISILAQERLLGAALGSVFAAAVVYEQRNMIYNSISESQSLISPQSQVREPFVKTKSRLDLGHLWNKAVDQTLGPVIESLSSRGW